MLNGRDLRIQKTYAALFHAFQVLLKEKTFEQITVKELCSVAKVRTATFYNHFSDKYDFFNFMIQELYHAYRKKTTNLSDLDGFLFYQALIQDALDLLDENKTFVQAVSSDAMMWTICSVHRKHLHDEILLHLIKAQKSGHSLATEPELLTELIIGSLEYAARWWCSNGKGVPKEKLQNELTNYLAKLVN